MKIIPKMTDLDIVRFLKPRINVKLREVSENTDRNNFES
jgi:hypothetical protein